MAQPTVSSVAPIEPAPRTTKVSLVDVTVLTPRARALLRKQGRLSASQVAELYGPAPLPQTYTETEARALVAALERLGFAARVERQESTSVGSIGPRLELVPPLNAREYS